MEVVTRTERRDRIPSAWTSKNSTLDVESAGEARREKGSGNICWINCDKMNSSGKEDREGGVPTG